MELHGEQIIRAPRGRVWDALNDPNVLIKCIPGCEEIEKVSETETHVRLMAKVGPVRARFAGKILMSEVQVPSGCTMSFEGAGGTAGVAKGKSVVTLVEQGNDTCLKYTVQASVGGKLGQIGGRLIDASAKKMADDFFFVFNEQISAPQEELHQSPDVAVSERAKGLSAAPATARVTRASSQTNAYGIFSSALSGEIARLLWLSVGVGLGGLIGHLWHF